MAALGLFMPVLAAGGFLWWIYRSDRFEKEPWPLVLKTAGFGAAAGVAALSLTSTVWPWLTTPVAVLAILLALRLPYGTAHWNEPYDGLVYGSAAGIGFGLVFTLPGLLTDPQVGYRVAIFSMPIYMMAGIVIGHHLSQFRLHRRRWAMLRGTVVAAAFLIGIEVAVGAGAQVVTGSNMLAGLMAYGSNMLAWIFATRAMAESTVRSPLNPRSHLLRVSRDRCGACRGSLLAGARFCSDCGHPVSYGKEA